MARSEDNLSRQALDLVDECGEYARLRALYNAAILRQAGELEAAAAWRRIADLVGEIAAPMHPQ